MFERLHFGELALGHVHLVAAQFIDVGDHFGALDSQEYKTRLHVRL